MPTATRSRVIALLQAGRTYDEIARDVGVRKSTISYHAHRAGLRAPPRRPRIDWPAVQRYHDEGHSVRECRQRFGFAAQSWHRAVLAGRIKARDWKLPVDILLAPGAQRERGHVRRRLLALGLLRNGCYECGAPPEWRGKPLVLVLDHINGVNDDWRLDNLRLLCPNCNSQTTTFCGRNVRRARS
jgi:DNA-binding transcriptional ArsR family regulator